MINVLQLLGDIRRNADLCLPVICLNNLIVDRRKLFDGKVKLVDDQL